jgi:hypothetical protein
MPLDKAALHISTRRATAALLGPDEPAAILGEPTGQARNDAGPSLEWATAVHCSVGRGTAKLAGRSWHGGHVALSQAVYYDPTLRGPR